MAKIRVNFWKPTGKWYESCVVEFPNRHMSEEEIKQHIVDDQSALDRAWTLRSEYYVTLDSHPGDYEDVPPKQSCFFNRLYKPGDFAGYKPIELGWPE